MKVRVAIAGAITAALLAGPAYAQQGEAPKPEVIEKKRNAEALDQRYKNALEHTSTNVTPTKTDPWENMRAAGDSKAKK